jgi:hypothetical protein
VSSGEAVVATVTDLTAARRSGERLVHPAQAPRDLALSAATGDVASAVAFDDEPIQIAPGAGG